MEVADKGGRTIDLKDERTILLIEDSPTRAEKLKLLFEGHGYKVNVSPGEAEALAMTKEITPALIIFSSGLTSNDTLWTSLLFKSPFDE